MNLIWSCIQYLYKQFCSERDLIKNMRQKHVVDHNDLHDALYYHWKFDIKIFALELECMQLAAKLLFLIFIDARPDAIFESDCKKIAETNVALLYWNVKLRLLQSSKEASLLILKIIIMLNKNKRKRNVL